MSQSAGILFVLGLGVAALLLGVQSPFRTETYDAPPAEPMVIKKVNLPLEVITDLARKMKESVAAKVGSCVHPFETAYVMQSGPNYVARFMFLAQPEKGMPYGVEADGVFDQSYNLLGVHMQEKDALSNYHDLQKDGFEGAAYFTELPTKEQLDAVRNNMVADAQRPAQTNTCKR